MGTWGTAILSDDVAADVYGQYMDDYDDGMEPADIRAKLEKNWAGTILDDDEVSPFWLALAKAQWTCGRLDDDVLQRVDTIIASGTDLKRWGDAGAEALHKRQSVLKSFLAKLSSPNPKPRRRRKRRLVPLLYQPGDCLSYTFPDGDYGAALVLANQETRWENWNLVGVLRFKYPHPPTLATFERREWLVLTHHNWDGKPDVKWCAASFLKKTQYPISLVGRIQLRRGDYELSQRSNTYGRWDIGLQVELQLQWENEVRVRD